MYLFSRLSSWYRTILAILTDHVPAGGWPWVYRGIHWCIVIGATVALSWFSPRIVPESDVNSDLFFVQRFYCGLVFVLAYVFVRALLFAIGLFARGDESEFPDIDAAWQFGLQTLDRAGIDLRSAPVFGIAGVSPAEETAFFTAAGLSWKAVAPTANEFPQAPLRFYVAERAIYLSLTDVGAHARQLAQPLAAVAAPRGNMTQSIAAPTGAGQRTLRPDEFAKLNVMPQPAGSEDAPGRAAHPAAPAGPMRTLRPDQLAGAMSAAAFASPHAPAQPESALPRRLEQQDASLGRRRLKHFLQLLQSERDPFCGMNGILAVLPLEWSATDRSLGLLSALREDVRQIHDHLHLCLPVVWLQCGLEQMPELKPFLERARRLAAQFEGSRAGHRFPAGAPVDREHSEWIVDRALEWFRGWVYALFAKSVDDSGNRDLYQFLCTLDNRRSTLTRQLELILGNQETEALPRLSGYYFAAKDPGRAFLQGVLQKLEDEQNEVTYTPSSCRRDRRRKALATAATIAAVVLAAVDIALAWHLWGPPLQ